MSKYHVVGVGKLWKEKDIFLYTFTVLAKLLSDRLSLLTLLLLVAGAGAVMTELYY